MSWKCPFCEQFAAEHYADSKTIEIRNYHNQLPTNGGFSVFRFQWDLCPNPSCKQVTVAVKRYGAISAISEDTHGNLRAHANAVKQVFVKHLLPEFIGAMQIPEYVPAQIRQDYYEACKILNLSPKASATLLRRCMQGMIRDFWKISKKRLVDEIAELEKQHPGTRELIDPIRQIGNIGAHMEADVNLIIDIEPEEAVLLKEMIEQLMEDWYIQRHTREQRIARIKAVVAEKDIQKKGVVSDEASIEVS